MKLPAAAGPAVRLCVAGMRAADGDTVYSSGAGWREADEEERILNELPPHWGIFDAEKR